MRKKKKKIEEGRRKETTGQKYNGPLLHRAAITRATPCVEVWYTSNLWPLRLGEEKKERRKKEDRNHRAKI